MVGVGRNLETLILQGFLKYSDLFYSGLDKETDILTDGNMQKWLFGIMEVYAYLCVFKILCTGCKAYSSCKMDWIVKEEGFFSIYLLWKMILGGRIGQEKGKRKRDTSIFKLHFTVQNYPYLIKNFCVNSSILLWVVSNCAFIIFWIWPEIMGSGLQKCSTFMDLTQKCFEPLKRSVMCAEKSDSMPSAWTLKIHECTWPRCLFLVPIK